MADLTSKLLHCYSTEEMKEVKEKTDSSVPNENEPEENAKLEELEFDTRRFSDGAIKFYKQLKHTSEKSLQDLSEELLQTAKQAQEAKDNAWESIKEKYRQLKEESLAKTCLRRASVAEEEIVSRLSRFRKKLVKWIKRSWRYTHIMLYVLPVLAAAIFVCYEHRWILYGGILYLGFVVCSLFYSVAVPNFNHKGVSWFTPYKLNEDEKKAIVAGIKRADERSKRKPKQGLYTKEDQDKPLFILSLDGGGIRGIVLSEILARISEEFPDFLDNVDLIAGCSTGSIVAASLCRGYTAKDVSESFRIYSPVVFRQTAWESLGKLGCLIGPMHSDEGKLEMLRTIMGGYTMKDLNCGICITSSHVEDELLGTTSIRCSPRVWTNVVEHKDLSYVGHHELDFKDFFKEEKDEEEEEKEEKEASGFSVLNMNLSDVVNGATAAPVYYPSYQDHVDGGLWSNNPAMAALATVIPHRNLDCIHLLSISTGVTTVDSPLKEHYSFGLFQWLPWLVDFLMDSTSRATHYNAKSLLGNRYHRLEPILPKYYELNDVSAMDDLAEAAHKVDLSTTFKFLEKAGFRRRLKTIEE